MRIDPDSVPSTVEKAVESFIASLSVAELQQLKTMEFATVRMHFGPGRALRNAWSLWDAQTPLKRDAVDKYGIAHADDISGLILSWAVARVRKEDFDPVEHCHRYHDHWQSQGTDALTAGGWNHRKENT